MALDNGIPIPTRTPRPRRGWKVLSEFAQGIALGKTAAEAFLSARPNVLPSSAPVLGCRLLKDVQVQSMIAHYRQALVENSTPDFILNRDEKRRLLTLVAITPVGQVDEASILAQEVKYKYATHPLTGETLFDSDGKAMLAEKVVKMVPKQFAVSELNKMDGHYEAEKAPVKALTRYDDAYIQRQLAASSEFQGYLREEAALEAARLGRVIEIAAIEVPPPRRSQDEMDAALEADEEFQKLLLEEE